MRDISSKTKLAALIGWPVGHSVSPAMHNTAYEDLGFDGLYVALQIPSESLEQGVRAMQLFGFMGCNVTIPHKKEVMAFMDELDDSAQACGAVNTVLFRDGKLKGYNTDGTGFVRGMREKGGFDPAGKTGLIAGAGGAALGVAFALAAAGTGKLLIVNRTVSKAEALASELNKKYPGIAEAFALTEDNESTAIKRSDYVVNTTNLGMMPNVDTVAIDTSLLEARHFVSDVVYAPLETRLLREAKARGCRTMNGIWMLVYQGLEAIRIWTGLDASPLVMHDAAVAALKDRQ